MKLIDMLHDHATSMPDSCAFVASASGEKMTYGELWQRSGAIAAALLEDAGEPADEGSDSAKGPVVVYGHKSPLMLASFVGCLRAGRAYVPVDSHSVPEGRAASIASQVRASAGRAGRREKHEEPIVY